MTDTSYDGPVGELDVWSEESAEDACRTLVHLLYSRREHWEPRDATPDGRGHMKRSLLIADYARKSLGLPEERKAQLDRMVIESFLPDNPSVPWRGVPVPAVEPVRADIGVVTVIREELDAVLAVFGLDGTVFETSEDGQRFYTAEIANRNLPARRLTVVVTVAGQAGQVHVGGPVHALVERFAPRAVFLLGTAAGVRDKVKLGDVVVSDRVLYYEPGRLAAPDVWQPRPESEQGRHAFRYGLFYYDPCGPDFRTRVTEFVDGLPGHRRPKRLAPGHVPEVHTVHATIATGEKVLRDGRSLPELRDRHDETIRAADMESYGFVKAVGDRRWLIFRGISDYGDTRQSPEWKFLSSAFAALSLQDFLRTGYEPPGLDRL
ncbi:5'-methylthioadenosine/S-adenosylhomocysteine nucleosidase family protein [Streptomyces sp. NPDC001617]